MKTSNAHRAAMGIFFASLPARACSCLFESYQSLTTEIKDGMGRFNFSTIYIRVTLSGSEGSRFLLRTG